MTKHGLFLTVDQLVLLRELIKDYEVFYLSPEEIEEAELIVETLGDLIIEVTDEDRYTLPEVRYERQGNSTGYHKC